MKRKSLNIFAILITTCLITLGCFTVNSFAVDCSSATITMIGVNPGAGGTGASDIKVGFKNTSGVTVGDWAVNTERFFFLSESLGNQGLATLLTAHTLEMPVWIRIADPGTPGSLVSIIYLNAR
jgi:hypothetical protein